MYEFGRNIRSIFHDKSSRAKADDLRQFRESTKDHPAHQTIFGRHQKRREYLRKNKGKPVKIPLQISTFRLNIRATAQKHPDYPINPQIGDSRQAEARKSDQLLHHKVICD